MSEFWKRKMITFFEAFDFDKDGYASEQEFADMARRFAEAYGANDERKKNIIKIYVKMWRMSMKAADIEKENRLTARILIESMKQQMYDPELIIGFDQMIRGLHELMAVNQDGYLQPEEHKSLFRNLGVPEGTFDEKFAFDAIDANGDGKLSIDEFVAAFFDFLFSQDESSPNRFYFGRLVA